MYKLASLPPLTIYTVGQPTTFKELGLQGMFHALASPESRNAVTAERQFERSLLKTPGRNVTRRPIFSNFIQYTPSYTAN